jgi:hypothetical protein
MAYRTHTFHSTAGATANGEPMVVRGHSAFSVQYLDVGTPNAVLTFEGSIDGTNWDAVYLLDEAGSLANTAGAPGIYHSPAHLTLGYFRARISTFTSGAISVVGISRV